MAVNELRQAVGLTPIKTEKTEPFTAKLVKIDEVPTLTEGTTMRIPATVFITKAKGERETFIVINDNYQAGAFA